MAKRSSSRTRDAGPVGRYSLDRCILEIAEMRDRCGVQDKDIWLSVGIDQGQFAHKMANAGKSRFSVRELGLIADYFSRLTHRPLIGWPFIPEQTCALLERHLMGSSGEVVPHKRDS